MTKKRSFLYGLLLFGCLAGYGWIVFSSATMHDESTVCLLKNVTGVPCPSCGSTRAVIALANGDFVQALQWNPLGLLIAAILIVAPWWIGYDLISRRNTLLMAFERTEQILKNRWVAAPAILAIVINWVWNITKGL